MRNLLLLFIFLAIFSACGKETAMPDAFNLDGFELSAIPGSEMQRAIKLNEKGKILEEGTVLNGKKNGTWVIYQKERDVPRSIGNYVNGVLNGPYFEYAQFGHLELICNYTNNVLDGRFSRLRNFRKTEEGAYLDGKLEGNFKKYYEGKEVLQQELNYKQDKLDGDNIYFNEKGDITMKYTYKNGEKVSGGIVASGK